MNFTFKIIKVKICEIEVRKIKVQKTTKIDSNKSGNK
jgi:hypothetical protein